MKLAFLMDPLSSIDALLDSTVAMIQRAQIMGWACVYFTQKDIFCRDGHAYAFVSSIVVRDELTADWAIVGPSLESPLSAFDVILMRKDPPFDLQYIYTTYALELAEQDGVRVVNKASSLRDANEKFFILHFPQCSPETLVSASIERLREFWQQHHRVIFKPLDGMGGRSIFHVDYDGRNLSVILEELTRRQTVMIMAQKYVPEISTHGDKRILIVHGKPIPYALARIPAPGEERGNLAAGASATVVPLTEHDFWICAELAPILQDKGLSFVGIDVIGDYLTEINVTSPTGIREIERATGLDISGQFLKGL